MAAQKVTVVIPLFNGRAFVRETLDSVAAQTYTNYEVVVVDDGSSDDGADLARAHPLRPTVLRQSNRGPAAARNAGIAAGSGDLVALLDADDLWAPEKLQRQVDALERAPDLGWACGYYEVFKDEPAGRRTWTYGPPLSKPPDLVDLLRMSNLIGTFTVVFRRRAWERLGPLDEDPHLIGVEDFVYWLRLARHFRLHYDPHVLGRYRLHDKNLVGVDWRRAALLETRAVARFLEREPNVTRELFGVSPTWFQYVRVARLVSRYVGGKRRALRPGPILAILRGWAELT